MGPVGCLLGLVLQVIHLVVLIIALPIVLLCKIFGGGKDE